MGEKEGIYKGPAANPRPTIAIPPRAPIESLFSGGFSPGPMTLISSFFSPQLSDSGGFSFSQLLAGAMASPAAANPPSPADGGGAKKVPGYKQNQPVSLMLPQSPLFSFPPGFSPSGLLTPSGFLSPLQSPFGMSHQQALAHVTAQAVLSQSYKQYQADYQPSQQAPLAGDSGNPSSFLANEIPMQHMDSVPSEAESLKIESSEVSQSNGASASGGVDRLENDGYNWRKYGQKQVKASEHPRSYYKCTHQNCPVKKKVQRAPDGCITEITYKGKHNHEPPVPKRQRDALGTDGTESSKAKSVPSQTKIETNMPNEALFSQPLLGKDNVSVQHSSELHPPSREHHEMEDTPIVINDDDDDQPNVKRRNTEVGASGVASSHKTVTEPRIIVQTRSEVDLLDDGFKWRKYGQKVVKGNPNPRSYYRCTYAGCTVRKHVERASSDPKAVITTYEGKHNHDIPTRNSSHVKSESNHSMQLTRT